MKKILSIVLALVMVLSLMPSGAVMLTASAETSGLYTYTVTDGEATITDVATSISGEVVIPSTLDGYPVTCIGYEAFYNCDSMTAVTIPDSVTSIADKAFRSCSELASVVIGNSVTTIGDEAFYWCSELTSVTVPASVTSIGKDAFNLCSIEEVYISDLTAWCNIDFTNATANPLSGAPYFYLNGTQLNEVVIPNGVTSIKNYAFVNNRSMASVTIPNGVTSIGDQAFRGCDWLTTVTIPYTVTHIGKSAFAYCSDITAFYVSATNPNFCADDGVLFTKNKARLIAYPCDDRRTSYTIPSAVVCIDEYAFAGCRFLTSVTFHEGLESINEAAFYNCGGLTSIDLPDSVTTIGNYAFSYCGYLTSADLGNGVKSIGNGAFACCSKLPSITIPDGVMSIGDDAFNSCKALTSIIIPDSVTSLGEWAFDYCVALESVVIGNGVTAIKEGAFRSCKALESVIIGDSVTVLEYDAFSGCEALTSVKIPNSVTRMEGYAFIDCESLESIVIPASVTTIDRYTFINCPVLTIYGYTGSYAETYAAENNIPFVALDGGEQPPCDHWYDNALDADCNECGAIREISADAPAFVVETTGGAVRAGDTFTVTLSTKNNPGIVSLFLDIGYDADALELISIVGQDFSDVVFGPLNTNPIAVNWVDTINPNNETDGVVAVLTFRVKEDAVLGDTELTLSYDPENVYDYDFENVTFAVLDTSVNVVEYFAGDVDGDGIVNNKDLGLLQRYLTRWEVEADTRAADVYRDGIIDNKDYGLLQRYINGWDVELGL